MKTKLTRKDHGFTIIEVMIVLAIAGLILAIIFLAVPSLQRNARNNSRRNDAAHLAGLVNEYEANHQGQLPTGFGNTGGTLLDISGENWAIVSAPSTVNTTSTANYGSTTTVVVNEGWQCNSGALGNYVSGSRPFAIGFTVETSSTTQQVCIPG